MLIIFRNFIVAITLLFATVLIFISALSWLFYGSGCDLKVLSKISLPNGIMIDYESMDCDVIAKYEEQSIYARMLPDRKRQLIFRFGPTYPDFKPNIYVQADGSILIEIEKISEVIYQAMSFRNKSVYYKIGYICYPKQLAK